MVALGAAVLSSCSESALAQRDREGLPEKPRKTETHGPAFSAGLGSQYVDLGVQVAYFLQLNDRSFRVAPFAAFGWATFGAEQETEAIPGVGAGIASSLGRKHRFTLDAFYAPMMIWYPLSLHGEDPDVRLEWGPGVTLGYEYAAFSGFFVRTNLGVQYMVTVPIAQTADRFYPALTLVGLGYKLW